MSLKCSKLFVTYAPEIQQNVVSRYNEAIQKYIQDVAPKNQEPFMKQIFPQQFCKQIINEKESVGVYLALSGVKQCISLNKEIGIRAAMVHSKYIAQMCRKHNDANVCIISTSCVAEQLCGFLVRSYLQSQFDHEERNMLRVDKLTKLEQKYLN